MFYIWIKLNNTCIGEDIKIELKTDIRNDISQFWTFWSPKDIPFTTIKNIETTIMQKENKNPIYVNHHGNRLLLFFLHFFKFLFLNNIGWINLYFYLINFQYTLLQVALILLHWFLISKFLFLICVVLNFWKFLTIKYLEEK